MKAVSLVALAVLYPIVSPSQSRPETKLPLGTVIERVAVQSSQDQSYAAFLPTSYTPDKRWPAIFCLDPRARGKAAADRFSAAAEKYGYVVVCSNNSRNGLDGEAVKSIMNDFWRDAHERLSIDENRTYFAGFSGGSRLAAAFAVGCRGCAAGVLGAGAGFPENVHPDSQIRFAYFGVVGVDDFNFGEMRELEKRLSLLQAPFHFQTFDAGHEWPPQSSIEDALAWFRLQAMKAGAVARDDKFLDQQLATRLAEAERLLAAGQLVDSEKAFLSIARDFQDLRDVKSVTEKIEQLKKSAALRKEERGEGEITRRQLKEVSEIRALWLKGPLPDESSTPRYEANIRLGDWRKKREATSDSRERRLARRILSHLLIESYEAAQSSLRQQKDYAQAISNYQLARAIEPKSANLSYELGRVYALNRDKKAALQALDEAIALGFKDVARIKSDEAFAVLAGEARFQKLILGMN